MIQVKREAPKCRKCGKTLEWLPWTGKPLAPVDPKTKSPCDCWKTKGKGFTDDDPFNKPRYLKKQDLADCPYCSGVYEKELGNELHEEVYHKDKKVHVGEWIIGEQCFEDEVLYYGDNEHWFMGRPTVNGDFLSVDGKENVREFAKKHEIKVIRSVWMIE